MDTHIEDIKIAEAAEKVSKNGGKYLTIKDSRGHQYSCWIADLFGLINASRLSGENIKVVVETKGRFMNIIGVDGVHVEPPRSAKSAVIGAAMERKEKSIAGHVERKENSITEAAIRRDSALFTSICWDSFGGEKQVDVVKNAHKYWTEYFKEMYSG